jgi:hypothetical protein
MSLWHRIAAFVLCLSLTGAVAQAVGSAQARPRTAVKELHELSRRFHSELLARRGPRYLDMLKGTEPGQKTLNEANDIRLMYINERGMPVYYKLNNINAAATVKTDRVWPGGGGGYSLTGSGTALGDLGIWDGGGVLLTHQEFGGRVTQIDSPSATNFHSTHVAGTMVAAGVDAAAKGMSYQGTLAAYDWENDASEMAAAAASGMNVSNHSYGFAAGWYWYILWFWYGDTRVDPVEDYYFGFYSTEARDWDQIAYDAPYYSIVIAAGNDRADSGAAPGELHFVWDDDWGAWTFSTDTRDPDGGADGYDCISHTALAKNVFSVGAVEDIPGGYSSPADVVMSYFSAWGPTDDGRIKPDLVANGIELYSCTDTSPTAYATYSGTSMASPNLSGSLNLLVRHYEDTHGGTTPLSSTIKAIAVQTADEAGPTDGPDYKFGWGLLNTLAAADLISRDSVEPCLIREDSLLSSEADTLYLKSDGVDPLRVTLSWTDPPGTPPPPSLNPTTIMLVNDLDVRLTHLGTATTFMPYVLDPASPDDPATTGDNIRDNVEQIVVASPPAGDYMIVVSHKGELTGGGQWYSLVASESMTASASETAPVPLLTLHGVLSLAVLGALLACFALRHRRHVRGPARESDLEAV